MDKVRKSEDPERTLRMALANDEFLLYGQPIVSVQRPGRYPMAEVLVRMQAEEDYMLPPGDFIPVFEHYRMMPELDRWVCAQSIRMLARESSIPTLCLNLHPQTLADEAFADDIGHELSRAHVEGKVLVFEFEHEDVATNEAGAIRLSEELRRRGCRICVSGFGTSSASLHSVKLLHPHILKLDGSLIFHLQDDKAKQARLHTLTNLAGALNVWMVAERVEDTEVLGRLRALGVDYAQGFGVFEPVPLKRLLFANIAHKPAGT